MDVNSEIKRVCVCQNCCTVDQESVFAVCVDIRVSGCKDVSMGVSLPVGGGASSVVGRLYRRHAIGHVQVGRVGSQGRETEV